MAPKFTFIHSNTQLVKSANELRAYAQAAWTHTPPTMPVYSATEDEAIAKATKLVDNDAAFGNTRWFLFMPMRVPVTVMISIDPLPEGPMWHVSLSTPNAQTGTAGRTPDMFAKRVLKALFGTAEVIEGPPEGAFKKVRHFRTPYEASVH